MSLILKLFNNLGRQSTELSDLNIINLNLNSQDISKDELVFARFGQIDKTDSLSLSNKFITSLLCRCSHNPDIWRATALNGKQTARSHFGNRKGQY